MSVRIFNGESEVSAIDPGNRGMNYGDGLFETMRVHRGALPLWPRHLARLREGAARLGIAMPATDVIEARMAETVAGRDAGVLKLLLVRGNGGRGYAPAPDADAMWMLSLHPLPASTPPGLRLHWCETRLGSQPALAGIKHCNRLEQVLARAEVERVGCDEGLMRDLAGNAVCATSANLLVLRDRRWLTPPIRDCGVAGVMRAALLAEAGRLGIPCHVTDISLAQLQQADELFLCNSVYGIWPVRAFADLSWPVGPLTRKLQGIARTLLDV